MNSKDFLKAGKAVFIKLGLIATTLGSAQASIIDNVATYTYTETQMVLLDGIDGCQNSQGCSRTYTTEAATGDLSLFTGGIASYYSDYQINPSLNALDGYQVTENVNISYLTNDSQDWDNAFGSSAKGQANSFVNNNGENVPFTYSDSNTVAATTASSALSVSLMAYQWRVNSTGNLDSVDMDISYLMWVEGWAEMFDEVTGGGEFSAESFMAIYDSEGNEVLADSLDISGYVDGASGRDSDFVPR